MASHKSLTSASAAGAVLSAFLASLCCIGPLVFAMLGIGGAGLLVKFEAYRPYFTGLTTALLGAGFYFTYREPKAAAASATEGAGVRLRAPEGEPPGPRDALGCRCPRRRLLELPVHRGAPLGIA